MCRTPKISGVRGKQWARAAEERSARISRDPTESPRALGERPRRSMIHTAARLAYHPRAMPSAMELRSIGAGDPIPGSNSIPPVSGEPP
jgi:hypothetical protein